jgi:hypothetical protein
MSCTNHRVPLYIISMLTTYLAHRNLIPFTTLTTPDNLYKSHSSSLRNTHPFYMSNPSHSSPLFNTANCSFSLPLLASNIGLNTQFPKSFKSVLVSKKDPTKQPATLVFCVPIYRAFWTPGWTVIVVKLTDNILRMSCSPFHHVSHFCSSVFFPDTFR